MSYVLTRWAWRRKGKPDVLRETLPFLGISTLVILIVSLATKLGYRLAAYLHLHGLEHVALVETVFVIANFGTFLTRFIVFNRVLFKDRGAEEVPAEVPPTLVTEVEAEEPPSLVA